MDANATGSRISLSSLCHLNSSVSHLNSIDSMAQCESSSHFRNSIGEGQQTQFVLPPTTEGDSTPLTKGPLTSTPASIAESALHFGRGLHYALSSPPSRVAPSAPAQIPALGPTRNGTFSDSGRRSFNSTTTLPSRPSSVPPVLERSPYLPLSGQNSKSSQPTAMTSILPLPIPTTFTPCTLQTVRSLDDELDHNRPSSSRSCTQRGLIPNTSHPPCMTSAMSIVDIFQHLGPNTPSFVVRSSTPRPPSIKHVEESLPAERGNTPGAVGLPSGSGIADTGLPAVSIDRMVRAGSPHEPAVRFDDPQVDFEGPTSQYSVQTRESTFCESIYPGSWNDAERAFKAQLGTSSESPDRAGYIEAHKTLAIATPKYSWDGEIPGRKAKGLPLRVGVPINICNIVNQEWYLAHHQDGCMYVPNHYVRIDSVIDEQCRKLFEQTSTSLPQSDAESIPRLSQGHESRFRLRARLRRLIHYDIPELDNNVTSNFRNAGIPPLPRPPLEREPHDMEFKHGRIIANTECQGFGKQGSVIVSVSLDLIPFPLTRITHLSLNVAIPGQRITEIYPEELDGPQTEVQHNDLRTEEIKAGMSGDCMVAGLDAGMVKSQTQEVAYATHTKIRIQGGGRNSAKATWRASEDIADRSGLNGKMKFYILLPIRFPPSKLDCVIKVASAKNSSLDPSMDQTESFEDRWQVNFV